MRIRPPSDGTFGSIRTYFTELDPVVQDWYVRHEPAHLAEKLTLLALSNDTITVAASHLVRSDRAFRVVAENLAYLEAGVIVPAINDDFDSFSEMVEAKLSQEGYQRPWRPDGPPVRESMMRERAHFLDDHAALAMGWELSEMRDTFRRGLLHDLEDRHSMLSHHLRDGQIELIRAEIDRINPFSRERILDAVSTHAPDATWPIATRMNTYYHLTGATVHRGHPNLAAQQLPHLGDIVDRSIELEPAGGDSDPMAITSPPTGLDDAFRAYADVIGLGAAPLRALDPEAVLELRQSGSGTRFRRALRETVATVRSRDIDPDDGSIAGAASALREEIRRRYHREQRHTSRSRGRLRTTLYVTAIGSLLAGAEELGATITILNPVIDKLADNLPLLLGNEFVAFGQELERTTMES